MRRLNEKTLLNHLKIWFSLSHLQFLEWIIQALCLFNGKIKIELKFEFEFEEIAQLLISN